MSPKKQAKTDSRAKALAALNAVQNGMDSTLAIAKTNNAVYFSKVQADKAIVLGKWPNLVGLDPLPEVGDTGFLSLLGFGAPFNGSIFTARRADPKFEYNTHINFMWQDLETTQLPCVPLYWERVLELADQLPGPGLLKFKLTLLTNFDTPGELPKGGLLRLSPCEQIHAILHKVATRIRQKASKSELEQWLRTLLSTPATFIHITGEDAKYAEANSLRQDIMAVASAVTFSARQLVWNIYGFKLRKERPDQPPLGADKIATIWRTEIRTSKSQESMTKTSTIDTCFTVMNRIFKPVPEAEDIVKRGEAKYGEQYCLNNLGKLQAIVERCGKSDKILWLMQSIEDQINSGKLLNTELTHAMIKSGAKSLSDPALTRLALKRYLLGEWLDGLDVPVYMKVKCRELFDSYQSFRAYSPLEGDSICDTTWLFRWPKFGKDLLNFLENIIFNPTQHEEHVMRLIVKNSNTPQEALLNQPWLDTITDLQASIRAADVLMDLVLNSHHPDPQCAYTGDGGGGGARGIVGIVCVII